VLGVLLAFSLTTGGWAALIATRPGNESFAAKAADWFRYNHMAPLANWAERTYFSHHAPPTGGTPTRAIPTPTVGAPSTSTPMHSALPAPITPIAQPALANEGAWQPVGPVVNGAPTMAVAQLRPDAIHTSVLAGVVWIDRRVVRFQLVPGTTEPGGQFAVKGSVPADQQSALIAAFNGGFRFQDAHGGIYTEGQMAKPLVDGAASLVLRSDGTVDVGQWGRDATLTADVTSVRQNLALIVDGGQPVAGLDVNDTHRWGQTLGNRVLVWRSGLGVRADGTLVYVAGDGLSVVSLADLLTRAGAVRAMELDINPEWVTFNLYSHPDPANLATIDATKLLPDMTRPAVRYLGADSRDFVAVYTR
jgi:hypothetical protein